MNFLYNPIKGMTSNELDDVIISQYFGNDPIAERDTWYGNKLVKKGQHVYQVLAGQAGHNGIDIVADRGKPIYAPADGWLIEAQTGAGLGIRASLRHEVDGRFFFTSYGHMEKLNVPVTTWNWKNKAIPIKLGQIIGFVDSTGYSTGDHLHWSLYEVDANGNKLYQNNGFGGAVDPFLYGHKKDIPMSNSIFVHKAGTSEYGFYLPDTSGEAAKDMALNLGLDILKADGSIDFSKAKEMELNA